MVNESSAIKTFLAKPWVIPAAVGVTTGGVGFVVGYFVAQKRWNDVTTQALDLVDEQADLIDTQEKQLASTLWAAANADIAPEVTSDPEFQNDPVDDIVLNKKHDPSDIVIAPPETEVVDNIWDHVDNDIPGWDWEEEKAARGLDPYILHRDEYFEQETDYSQTVLTYYSGDDILADEKDTPIYNYSEAVGALRFGHGSGDPNVLYVRNDKLHSEFEILLHDNSFEVEVLGLEAEGAYEEDELKHSKHYIPKMRLE